MPLSRRLPHPLIALILSLALLVPVMTPQPADAADAAPVEVTGLTVERDEQPLGLDVPAPRLGWVLESEARGVLQTAYQVQVASSAEALAAGDADVWDSGRVTSDRSVHVNYGGPELEAETRYHWRVRIWDDEDEASDWSAASWWETGLLEPSGWDAEWIAPTTEKESWDDHTVETVFTLVNDGIGVFLRATDTNNAYMWQVGNFGGNPTLRPHVKVNGAWTLLKEISIADVIPPGGFDEPHTMRVVMEGEQFTTFIDGVQVDQLTDGRHSAGTIGFRSSTTESAIYRSITVSDADGVLFTDDFTDGRNRFGAGTITEDGLAISGNIETLLSTSEGDPLLRRDFTLTKPVERARLYASSLGVHELRMNGQRVGENIFAPGWTDYDTRIQYETHDVTELLIEGDNTIGAMLGDGWYAGRIAWFGNHQYGEFPHLLAQLRIDYADGTSETIVSDEDWTTASGPIISSDMMAGEVYDARAEQDGWDTAGFDDSAWEAAVALETDATERLVTQVDPPVRIVEELPAVAMTEPSPGRYIFDLGQNMVGVVRLNVEGDAGQTVTLRHGEVLTPDGQLYTANLRTAEATDTYTLKGGGPEVFQPRFTFHGFRYVEVTGYPGVPTLDDVTGMVMHTDAEFTSTFETSNPMLNQLQSNILWGQRGNFLSVPTDTPARDERLGWSGDINVFVGTAAFNMDVLTFLTKWMDDMRDAQSPNGAFPDVAPKACCGEGSAGWADAAITVPWTLWQRYGDTEIIEENYDAMAAWIDFMREESDDLIRPNYGYGDWLNLNDNTSHPVIGTAYFAYSTALMAQMAEAIGRTEDAQAYVELYAEVREAFQDAFVSDTGRVTGNSQTAYVLALGMDLIPEDLREAAAGHLAERLEVRDWHLSTGFLGTPDLLPVLSENGNLDGAYRLLLNEDYPSWGYQINLGATTMWERWDSIRPDGTFQDVGMNSFNHYAYGAVGDWMYRTIGGIEQAAPGYKEISIRPQPGGGLTSATTTYDSVYGTIATDWERDDERFSLDVEIPGNTTATVHVPADDRWSVLEGGVPAEEADNVTFVGMADGAAVYEVGSGSYAFATDAVLGNLGTARAEAEDLRAALAGLELSSEQRAHLDAELAEVVSELDDAIATHLGGNASEAGLGVHRALALVAALRQWVDGQTMPEASASAINAALASISAELSAASGVLVGAVLSLNVAGDTVYPGSTTTVEVVLENTGTHTMSAVDLALSAPEGWTIERQGDAPATTLESGQRATATFAVDVPADRMPGVADLTATATYRVGEGTATLTVTEPLAVDSPLAISNLAIPTSVTPGAPVTVRATVTNNGPVTVEGALTLEAPDGWAMQPDSSSYTLAPGESHRAAIMLTAGFEGTAGAVEIRAVASYAGHVGATESATIDLRITNAPIRFIDHLDVGSAESEQAHGLTASPTSNTNPPEAGFTRRYTQFGVADAYFEFDLAVEPGEPFVIRALETYDGPQLKDYDVFVDGARVHQRSYQRTDGGAGTVIYQFLVDAEHAPADGTVQIRFAEDAQGANYDPSIADVWTLPVARDLEGDNVAEGATVTARSSLQGGDWNVANLTDGHRRSLGGGARGYTSNPPQSTRDAVEGVSLDFGAPELVDTVVLFPRTETPNDTQNDGTTGAHFPTDFTIDVSDDGETWTTVRTVTAQPHPGSRPQVVTFDEVVTRHLRVHVTRLGEATTEEGRLGFHRLQLAEVEAYRAGAASLLQARFDLDRLVADGGITPALEAKIRHALDMFEAWIDDPRKLGPALSHLDRAVHLLLWQADVIERGKPDQGDPEGLRVLAETIAELAQSYRD